MRIKALVLAGVLLVVALPLFAPIYMKFEGISGESKAPGHEGWIELQSLNFSPTQASATGGGGAGKVAVHDISISKKVDSSSPALMKAAVGGQHFQNVTIDMNGQRFLLQGVLISSIQHTGGANTPNGESEALKLSYERDVTHDSPVGGNVANKKFFKYDGNAMINGGAAFGAPFAVALRSLHLLGNNRAVIDFCKAAGATVDGGGLFIREAASKQHIGTLTVAVNGGTTQAKVNTTAYKEMPATNFTFTDVTVLGTQPMGDGCTQASLNFTRFQGPAAGFDYIK